MEHTLIILNVLALLGEAALLYLVVGGKAYSEQKGKNLATKEDVAGITREIERVRAEYAERLQQLSHENASLRDADQRRHQLSMAALDKRLEAHQKAFSLWRQFSSQVTAKDSFQFFKDCEIWWDEHCLYLSPEAGDAFRKAMHAAFDNRDSTLAGTEAAAKNWDTIYAAGTAIAEAVQLPGLKPDSLKQRLEKSDGDV